jgi:hypothetical protein
MLQPLNRIETVLREILINHAKGADLNRLSAFYGFRRPQYIAEEYWRKALLKAVYSARGTPGPIFSFLEAVFGEWVDTISTYDAVAMSPNIIQFSGVNTTHEGRYCRIDGKLYRTTTLRGAGYPNDIVLQNMDTTLFTAANFTPSSIFKVKFLPFDVEEEGCEYRILVDNGILDFPKYYIPTNVAENRASGMPKGGHIMDFFSSDETHRRGDQVDGPYPIYLAADEFKDLFFDAMELLLAAGVHAVIKVTTWSDEDVTVYGSIFNRRVYGSTSPSIPPLITPTRSA